MSFSKSISPTSPGSNAASSPLSSAPNSPILPGSSGKTGTSSENSTDSVTSGISQLGISPRSTGANLMTALREFNDREGTLITPTEFQTALSLVDNRYGVKTCGAALLGLGPDYSVGMENIGRNLEPVEFSEDDCRAELALLNHRTQTSLSLGELNVVLTLVNKRYGRSIAASDVLEWLHQAVKNKRLSWRDEVRGNITCALAFLGATSSMEVSLADLEKTFALLDLKGTGAQIMTVLMSMPEN